MQIDMLQQKLTVFVTLDVWIQLKCLPFSTQKYRKPTWKQEPHYDVYEKEQRKHTGSEQEGREETSRMSHI